MGAKHITPAEVIEMQRLYVQYGTYAAVARETSRSASSVAKYIKMKNVPQAIKIAVENLTRGLPQGG